MMARAAQVLTGGFGEQAAQVRLDEIRKVPGEKQREDQRGERDGFAQETAHGANDGGKMTARITR